MKTFYLIALVLVSLPLRAQDSTAADVESLDTEDANTRPIEEILIISERSMGSLRFQVREAREELFSALNDLNTDDDFDVNCRKSNRTDTLIQRQICDPLFFDMAVAQNTQDANPWAVTPTTDVLLSESQIRRLESENFQRFREILLEIAEENEAFASELLNFANMRRELRYREQECLDKPAVLFLFRKC